MKTKILLFTMLFVVCCQPLSAQVNIPEFLAANTDGTTGYYLKQVSGGVIIANNQSVEFYPASSIKVLQHLHAMLQVQRRAVALDQPIAVAADPCVTGSFASKPTLSFVLRQMMKHSDNNMANVIQVMFGRSAINATAHNLAFMSDRSHLDHKFGCVNDGPLTSGLTLEDIGALYETVALGNLLTGQYRDSFYSLMRNESDRFFVAGIVDQEAGGLGVSNSLKQRFKSHIKLAFKTGSKLRHGVRYRSKAGYVSLPFVNTCNHFGQVSARKFVFGVFIDRASRIIGEPTDNVAAELFRDQIRRALQSWKNCPVVLEPRTIQS